MSARWPGVTTESDPRAEADLSTHAGAADPHPQYQREVEKGAASGYAPLDSGLLVPVSNIPPLPRYDRDNGQPGMYGTPFGSLPNASLTLIDKRIYMLRFVPSRNMAIVSGAFGVSTASTADDQVDIGLFDVNGNLLGHAGTATGQLNSTGRKVRALLSTVNLTAGTVYYSAMLAAVAGTAAVVSGYGTTSANFGFLFEALAGGSVNTLPNKTEVISTVLGASGNLPSLVNAAGNTNTGAVIAWREF